MLKLTRNNFNPWGYWSAVIENMVCPDIDMLYKFDQSGYDLCPLEQEYAKSNMSETSFMRYHNCIRQDWYQLTSNHTGVHINHADLYERKGYSGHALEQLTHWATGNNLLYKLIKLNPKWGIDISMDYVDRDQNVMELFHFEWDDHNLDNVLDKKEVIELIILNTDWDDFAKTKLRRKDEWQHLDFVGQSEWTTKFLGLPKERFKLVPWKNY